jgi:hypothetical protein
MSKDEALRLALEMLDNLLYWDNGKSDYDQAREAITAIKQALAAPVQELDEYDAGLLNDYGGGNVEWWQDYIHYELGCAYEHYKEQLTTPRSTQRPWVGLTEDEINQAYVASWGSNIPLHESIEAKLKEKNT